MCEWDELEKNQYIYPIKTFGKGEQNMFWPHHTKKNAQVCILL